MEEIFTEKEKNNARLDKQRIFSRIGKDAATLLFNLVSVVDNLRKNDIVFVENLRAHLNADGNRENVEFNRIKQIYKMLDIIDRKIEALIEVLKGLGIVSVSNEEFEMLFKDALEFKRIVNLDNTMTGTIEVVKYNFPRSN